jgi:hypothetical protein
MGRQARAWRPIVYLCLAATMLVAGCSKLGPSTSPPPQSQRNVLLREEILASTAQQGDLLDAIHSLRPTFLATPRSVYSGSSAASAPLVVYVDRMRQTGIEALRSISATKVAEVRYLDPTAALSQFGPIASGGALLVKLFDPSREPPASQLFQ